MASLAEASDSDKDDGDLTPFRDFVISDFSNQIKDNKKKREEGKKRKGSPPLRQDDDTTTQEQKRRSPAPAPYARAAPPFIREAHDLKKRDPPTPVKPKEKKQEAVEARPKEPKSAKSLDDTLKEAGDTLKKASDVPLPTSIRERSDSLEPLPIKPIKRRSSIDFNDVGKDPMGQYEPNGLTRDETMLLEEVVKFGDKTPEEVAKELEEGEESLRQTKVLDSFSLDLLKAVADFDGHINDITEEYENGLITQEERDDTFDSQIAGMELAKEMLNNQEQSIKNYRNKACAKSPNRESGAKKLTDRINIKF